MQQIVLLLLCLLVSSASSDYGWRPRQEYRFSVEGRTVAGIPSLKHQYSGIHFMGSLRVQAQSSEILLMKLQNMTYTRLHTHLPMGWWQTVPESQVSYREFPITNSPFIVRLEKGVVERLVVSSNLDAWEVNFVQAVVGHLQLDLSANNRLQTKNRNNRVTSQSDAQSEIYTVMENSVVGRCEVLYEITPKSKVEVMLAFPSWMSLCGRHRDFIEITKTYNYSRCEYIAESHFGLPRTLACNPGGNECGTFWTRAAMSHSIGCGDRKDMILLNTVSSSRVLAALRMQPEDSSRGRPGSQASIGTYLNLTLLSAKPYGQRRFGQPTNPVNIDGLRYQFTQILTNNESTNKKSTTTPAPIKRHHSSSSESTSTSNEPPSRHKHHNNKYLEKTRRPSPPDSPEMANISPESRSIEHSMENRRPWGRQKEEDDMSKAPLLPFSSFSMAHREGEARACLVQQLKELISDIANDMDVPKNIPEKMSLEKIQIAVQMCRTMKYPELLRAVGSIMNIDARETRIMLTERKILRDVVLMCGTNPAFRIIKAWLEQRKIRGEAAAEMIAALPSYLMSPSPSLVQQFYELVRDCASSDDQQVKISSVLAFSHLLREACMSKASRKARFSEPYEPCRSENATQYLTYLTSQMRGDPTLRRVYITAVGNTGANAVLPVLMALARDSSASPYQRASAILASRFIIFKDPKSATPTLMGFYHNPTYPTAVRIAALSLLFYTRPPLTIWQRIAISTWYETNPAIKAYVWSTLSNLATTQDPFYKEMTEHAIATLPLVRAVPLGTHRPYNLVRTAVASGLHEVVLEQLSWSSDLAAANIYYRQTQRLGGFSRLQMEADLWLADADGFMSSFAELLSHTGSIEKSRPPISELPHSTHWIREHLKIATRELPRTEGHFAFRLGALHERMFPFDHKIMSSIDKAGRRLLEQIQTFKPVLYQKMGETGFWLGTPTELGFPMTLKVNVPWAVRAKAEINGSRDNNSYTADVSLMYTSQLTSELSVYTPADCIEYVAGANSQTFMHLIPMRVSTRWTSTPQKQAQFSLTSLAADEHNLLFSQTSRPYTAQHDVVNLAPISLAKSTMTVNVASALHSELLPGTPFMLHYSSQAPNHRWSPEPHWVLSYPTLWPGLEAASLQLYTSRPMPINISFTLDRAHVESGEIVINTQTPAMSVTSTTAPSLHVSTTTPTPTMDRTTYNYDSSTTPSSRSDEDDSREEREQDTSMEEMLNTNLTILTSNIDVTTGTFNASGINLLSRDTNKTRSHYLLQQVLSGMDNGKAYIVGITVGLNNASSTKFEAFWTLAAGRARRFNRAGLFVVDDNDKWQLALTSTLQIPPVPMINLTSILKTNLTSSIFVDFKYSANNADDLVSVKGAIMRTENQNMFMRNHSVMQECLKYEWNAQPQCRRLGLDAGYLDRYNLTITYNENAQTYGGPVQHYFSLAKHALFPYVTEEVSVVNDDIPKNRVKMVAEINPDSHTVAVWMRTPRIEAELSGMPINHVLMQTVRINPIAGFMARFQDPSFCSVEADRVVTFDGSRYTYRMGNCWHVLAKDCSGRSRVVVLARNNNNYTEVEVNIDNHKVVRLLPNGEAKVNEMKVDLTYDQIAEAFDQAGTRLLELTCGTDDTLRLQLPAHGVTVLLGNNTIIIQAKSRLRGRLCGICGDFDGELESDFRGPGGTLIFPPRDFAKSYSLSTGSCHNPR